MAKRRRNDQPEVSEQVVQPRRHRRLRQQEAKTEQRIIIGVGIAVGLVVVLLLAAVISEFVIQPRRAIAEVNEEAIPVADFQRRLRFDQDNLVNQIDQYVQFGQQFTSEGGANPFSQIIQQLFESLSTPERYSLTVMDNMIEETLIRQLAAEYDVAVGEEEIQLEIEQQFGYERDAVPVPTPEASEGITDTVEAPMTADEFQTAYDERVAALGDRDSLTEAEFRALVALPLLRERLTETVPLEYEATEEQISARHILINADPEPVDAGQAEADALQRIEDARARIDAGEAFTAVAIDVSDDSSAAQGGDLGWFGRGAMVPEFEEAAFALQPGEISEPIKSDFGYHLILVEEVNEEEDQVKARHILARVNATPDPASQQSVDAEALAEIEAIRARILAGESFEDIAAEVSDDATNADQGGDLGWFGRGTMVPEFDEVAFSLEAGTLSEPVKTQFGYHLIQVEENDAEREVDEAELDNRRNAAFAEWLRAQNETATIENNWSLDYVPALPTDLAEVVQQIRLLLLGGAQAPVDPVDPVEVEVEVDDHSDDSMP